MKIFVVLMVAGALSVSFVSTAFAEAPEWLWNGASIAAELASENTGEYTLTDEKAPGGAVSVVCSALAVGTVGSGNKDLTSEVLSLGGSSSITCAFGASHGACLTASAPVVKAVNLPWSSELQHIEFEGSTLTLDLSLHETGKQPGYSVSCKTILGEITDTCTGEVMSHNENVETGVNAAFGKLLSELTTGFANCTLGGEHSGIIEGSGVVIATGGGTLSVT